LTQLAAELARVLRLVSHTLFQVFATGNRKSNMTRILLKKFLADETGATAIEYGLIAAGIALAIIAIVNGMGSKLNTKFTSINSSLK
jgi:pilus assembly protein Flp/PilA